MYEIWGHIQLLPVSYSDVTVIFEGYLFGINLITRVAMSFPTLKNWQQYDNNQIRNNCIYISL